MSYCATCDGAFFRGLEVYVVGGGDSAVEEALFLTRFARKVTIIHRRDQLRAVKSLQDKAFANAKIDFIWDSVVESLDGQDVLQTICLRNVKTGETKQITADETDGMMGLFVFVGLDPNSGLLEGKLPLEKGYIKTDENMRTAIPGVFAAGDIRVKGLRQIVTAAADGAIAAMEAERYLAARGVVDMGEKKGLSQTPLWALSEEEMGGSRLDRHTRRRPQWAAGGAVFGLAGRFWRTAQRVGPNAGRYACRNCFWREGETSAAVLAGRISPPVFQMTHSVITAHQPVFQSVFLCKMHS